ncbi:ECF transporter S component [Proteiniborus sp.]|uniref:ECF transporter S component n=1 Tax=Proteiniborus sp. TaxID=2079015 RepID=UPI003322AA3C
MKRFLNRFSMFDLVIIALTSALGIAIKPIIVPLIHIITGPLFIPGGAAAGGFYMLWLVLGIGITGKIGTGTLIGFIQALLVIITGAYGTHGAISIITYTLPGVMVDVGAKLARERFFSTTVFFILGLIANVSGTFLSSLAFFRLPLIPLLLSLSAASLSGGLGGLIAYKIAKELRKTNIINNTNRQGDVSEK